MSVEIKPCPFCGTLPVREINRDVLSVSCPNCVSVGFHSHVRFGCQADAEWGQRAKALEQNSDNVQQLKPKILALVSKLLSGEWKAMSFSNVEVANILRELSGD